MTKKTIYEIPSMEFLFHGGRGGGRRFFFFNSVLPLVSIMNRAILIQDKKLSLFVGRNYSYLITFYINVYIIWEKINLIN